MITHRCCTQIFKRLEKDKEKDVKENDDIRKRRKVAVQVTRTNTRKDSTLTIN